MAQLNKKGSHLEIIISFLIFVIFITLLFLVVRPTRVDEEKSFLLKHLEGEFANKLEAKLVETSVVIKTTFSSGETCFSIPTIQEGDGKMIVVKDKDKNKVGTMKVGDRIYIDKIDQFFNIYFSEDIIEDSFVVPGGGCVELTPDKYSLGLIKEFSFISYEKMQQLDSDIEDPDKYLVIKRDYGVPENGDFGFFLRTTNVEEEKLIESVSAEQRGSSVEVYATEFPISYIDSDAKVNQGWINIQVW